MTLLVIVVVNVLRGEVSDIETPTRQVSVGGVDFARELVCRLARRNFHFDFILEGYRRTFGCPNSSLYCNA
jgi:hypothetical protein